MLKTNFLSPLSLFEIEIGPKGDMKLGTSGELIRETVKSGGLGGNVCNELSFCMMRGSAGGH